MVTSIPVVESSLTTPRVRLVSFDQPWEWLAAGWKDLWRAPVASIPYGLLFVVMGYVLVYLVESSFQYALALTTGFLLAGPFLAMGLYDISRRLEAGPARAHRLRRAQGLRCHDHQRRHRRGARRRAAGQALTHCATASSSSAATATSASRSAAPWRRMPGSSCWSADATPSGQPPSPSRSAPAGWPSMRTQRIWPRN